MKKRSKDSTKSGLRRAPKGRRLTFRRSGTAKRAKVRTSRPTAKRFFFILSFSLCCLLALLGARRLRGFVERRLTASHRLERIEIATAGTLPRGQVLQLLRLPRGVGLGSVDIHRCRENLLKCPQIRDAHVERSYPNTLRVKILERIPAFRISQSGGKGWSFISPDGFVFYCGGLSEKAAAALPQLHCSTAVPEGTTLFFIPELYRTLQEARQINGPLVATWSAITVDESAYRRTGKVEDFEVRCAAVVHLRLRCEDLLRQFEELEYILSDAKDRHLLPLEKVDLTIRGRAYVKPLHGNN
jgi:hypothetical protein